MIVAESEAVFRDHITRESIEAITEDENPAAFLGFLDPVAQQLHLVLNDRLKSGDTSFREHRIEGCSTDGVEVAFGCCEGHCVGPESSRHPLIFVVPVRAGVQLVPVIAVFDVELFRCNSDDWACFG